MLFLFCRPARCAFTLFSLTARFSNIVQAADFVLFCVIGGARVVALPGCAETQAGLPFSFLSSISPLNNNLHLVFAFLVAVTCRPEHREEGGQEGFFFSLRFVVLFRPCALFFFCIAVARWLGEQGQEDCRGDSSGSYTLGLVFSFSSCLSDCEHVSRAT